MKHLNKRIEAMQPSSSIVLTEKAKEMQKKNPIVISLSGGEPDFDTPDKAVLAAIRSLTRGDTHYMVGPGLPELRHAIREKLEKDNQILWDENLILVTPGGKNSIYLAIHAILNEGDEVIILDPSWVSYEPIVQAAGGVCVRVKLDYKNDYRITEELLESAYTEKTRMLIVNYPNNPTGRILHPDEADVLEAFLKKHEDVFLLSDEVYERILYDGLKTISMASRESVKNQVITVNGFSKSSAMTGWRLGYMAAPEPVFKLAYKLYQHSLTCMSGFLQYGALAALSCKDETESMRAIYQQRRDMFIGKLNSINGVHSTMPEGAFYAWVYFDLKGMTSEEICEYLMEHAGVVGMPGSAYGEETACCMRFSFAAATADLERAADRIREAVEKLVI